MGPFDSDLAESLVLHTSSLRIILGTDLFTGGRTRASWEIVGRLRFLDAVTSTAASPGSFIFSGSFWIVCIFLFEGAAGREPEECISEVDEATREQGAPAGLAREVLISV